MQITKKVLSAVYAKPFRAAVVILIVLLFIGFMNDRTSDEVAPVGKKPVVTLTTAAEFSGTQRVALIGTVRAVAEATITAERSGQVVSVPVSLGQTVQAGQIIATLENASERAAVLQAEGVYEAALAAAAQSTISVDQANTTLQNARQTAISTVQSAYNTVNGTVLNSVDQFFANPSGSVPGLRVEGKGYTTQLNSERIAYQTLLPEWQARTNTLRSTDDLAAALTDAATQTRRTIAFIDTFLTVFSLQDNNTSATEATTLSHITSFTSLRANLLATQTTIDNTIANLESANDSVRQATLAAAGGATSAADAQVKQALGTLRTAEANLAKTILRSPISGTVNTLSVRTGDFINAYVAIAKIANNEALEVVTYISENDRDVFAVGDIVSLDDSFAGRVSEIAPAIDSQTRKIEVRIAAESAAFTTGDTVHVVKDTVVEDTNQPILIPLAAVKLQAEDGFVFFVTDTGKLVAQPVVLGAVRGNSIEIVEGITRSDAIVSDARGLHEGTDVLLTQ